MKAHYKRKNRFRVKKVNYRCDESEFMQEDVNERDDYLEEDYCDDFEDSIDDLFLEDRSPSNQNKKKVSPRHKVVRITNRVFKASNAYFIIPCVIFLLLGSPLLYFKFINSKAISNLSTVVSRNINGSVITVNDLEIDISSTLLSIREVSSSQNPSIMEKLLGTKSSSVSDLVNSISTGKVNFSKVANLVLFERDYSGYNVFSSSDLKIRYSNLDDGYLLEINNKKGKEFSFYYSVDGSIDKKVGENKISVKNGLTQVFLNNSVDINLLCRNLSKLNI